MRLLSLEKVHMHYKRGRRHVVKVLVDVSLEIWPAEVVCVMAPRGQGKTTLMRVAAGIERPAAGQVILAGQDVWSLSDRHRSPLLASEIGLVKPTKPHLDVPVLDHVAMPLMVIHRRRRAHEQARHALKLADVADCAAQYWASLSDDERARVAVARAIAEEPRLLIVDDLTAMLRGEKMDSIAELLRTLADERGFGVLASVSNLHETRWSDHIATLSGGELLQNPREPKDQPARVLHGPWSSAG